ncbi:DUF1573 domain-containing protein [Candidatus Parcubacteria bacterium]|nr:MAG: DUF1573 domain-containing protein [Candidatus Parcubacteria bacterium]
MDKSCCNTMNNKDQKKSKIDPFLAGIIIITVFLLGAAVYFGTQMGTTTTVTTDNQVQIAVDSYRHNWETIDYDNGMATKEFSIKNTGKSPLKIYNVITSCMCTTAQLKTSGITSEKFGMHEKSAGVFEIKPGQTAKLMIEFDPAFHGPSGVGPVTRIITMDTNDPQNPKLSFELIGNVVKK